MKKRLEKITNKPVISFIISFILLLASGIGGFFSVVRLLISFSLKEILFALVLVLICLVVFIIDLILSIKSIMKMPKINFILDEIISRSDKSTTRPLITSVLLISIFGAVGFASFLTFFIVKLWRHPVDFFCWSILGLISFIICVLALALNIKALKKIHKKWIIPVEIILSTLIFYGTFVLLQVCVSIYYSS